MLRVAIIGLGNIARVHLEGIACFEGAVLVAGCDTNPAQKSLLPKEAAFYTNFEEMLAREKPDVVHICLPHFLHYPAARAAAVEGCHIFTEKPLALNSRLAAACAGLEEQ
ncbi:MAG: Gfo/Idh/MocA family protein [Oscillospiraceae bacterium]